MNKTSRTILFFILFFLFIIIAPMIIFYSEGYRFDFEKGKLIETGGLYIKTNLGDADILINDKTKKNTSNFSKSAFVQDLTPGIYNIKIYKENYFPWEKNIEIEEKKVSEINIDLFSKANVKTLINEDVLEIFKINNGFIIKKDSGFYYFYPNNQKEELIIEKIDWDEYEVIKDNLLTKKDEEYYLSSSGIKNFSDIGQRDFKMDGKANFYYLIEDRLYKNNKIIENNIDFYEIHNDLLYIFKEGYLFEGKNKLNQEPFEIENGKSYELIFISGKIFLNDNNERLYLLDSGEFKKLINLNNFLEYAEWDGKILLNDGENIWIYFSKESYYPIFTNENTLKLLIKDIYGARNLTWINDRYFIYTQNGNIIASEFDFRDALNNYALFGELLDPQIFFDYENKILYIFDDQKIYKTNKII